MASYGQSCTSTGSAFLHQAHPLFLKLPISSFFFRIHTDDWIACRLKVLAFFGSMLELRIALWWRAARVGASCIAFGQISLLPKKLGKRGSANAVSGFSQPGTEVLQRTAFCHRALTHRVACCFACQKPLQRRLEHRIARLKSRSSSARGTQPRARTGRRIGRQLPLSASDGHQTQASNLRDQALSAMTNAPGFKRGKPPPLWLIQAANEDVHLMVMALFQMRRVSAALGTPACMHS